MTPLLGRSLKIFIILIGINLPLPLLAANKFIHLSADAPMPADKFIFTLVHRETGEIWLGYSKTAPTVDSEGESTGGIRNGGHVALLRRALGNPESLTELFALLGKEGEGKFIGGGFVSPKNGEYIYLHEYYSYTANGQAAGYENTINPLLPDHNIFKDGRFFPEKYAPIFHGAIIKRTGKPLKSAPTLGSFLGFQDNRNLPATYENGEQNTWHRPNIDAANLANASYFRPNNCPSLQAAERLQQQQQQQ